MPSLTPISKAYQPGSITYHQKNADINRRKKRSSNRATASGAAIATGGALLHGARPTHTGKAAMVVGGGIVAGGLATHAVYAHRQNADEKLAQQARLARAEDQLAISKSAFGVIHKGTNPLAAADDVAAVTALASGKRPGKAKSLTPVVPPQSAKIKPSPGARLNNAIADTGGSPS
jgi:hypothetical protein